MGAFGRAGSTPVRKLVSLTSPERKTYENMQLQQWREQEAFDAKIAAVEAERDALKRTTMALGQSTALYPRNDVDCSALEATLPVYAA